MTEENKAKQLTFKEQITRFLISPQEDIVLFPQESHGDERHHLYLLPLEKEAQQPIQITSKAFVSWALGWHPNGKEVSRSFAEGPYMGIETINLESKESFVLKENTYGFIDLDYSHDGKWIAVTASTEKGAEIQLINRKDPEDVIYYNFEENSEENSAVWSPTDKWIAFQTNAKGNKQILIKKVNNSEEIFLNVQEQEEAQNFSHCCWMPNEQGIYYIVSKHGRSFVREHSLNNEINDAIPFPKGQIEEIKLSKDGKCLVGYHSSMISPGSIYKYQVGTNAIQLVTPPHYNIEILKILCQPQSIWYPSYDNRKIHGWYIPAKKEANEPSQGLVFVHGGPTDQVFDEWSQGVYLQSIANSGFGVFAVNYRGSTGYGSEFQKLNIGDLGGGDLDDIVHAAKWLQAQPEIHNDQIGIVGASYGGYMTLYALVKKPDVFKAGLSLVPVIDWIEDYKHLIANRLDLLFGGTPDEKEDLYRDRSPITHVDNIKAPVMIVAGDQDSRCPIEPIRLFVEKLKEKNHPYKYIEYNQAGHNIGLEDRSRRARDFFKMMRFLKKNLK